jgi:hypothetical protein
MRISSEGVAFEYQTVDKIGAATGWRTGTVTQRRCLDVYNRGDGYLHPDFVLRCQVEVQWRRSGNGDSGGPVFVYNGDRTATLLGLHWGANGSHLGWYSPMANIRNDFWLRNDDFSNFKVR